jgi:hypothetical protein
VLAFSRYDVLVELVGAGSEGKERKRKMGKIIGEKGYVLEVKWINKGNSGARYLKVPCT